jgi:hypothetical protein
MDQRQNGETADRRGGRLGLGALLLAVFLAGGAAGCSLATHPTTGATSPNNKPGGQEPNNKGKPPSMPPP